MKIKELEKDIQRAIIQYLTMKKVFFWRNNSGAMVSEYNGNKRFMRFGEVGSPDICVIKDGFFIGLEVKTEKGKQSIYQLQWETDLILAGGQYYVVRSIDDVIKIGL
jgi:hypothetical protein